MSESHAGVRFSVAVIVRDAADALRLTLASIREIADEIVVLDTGSTDRSRDVAREFGARLAELSWNDDFSAARNEALRNVSGTWVLWLDAGETLNDGDTDALKKFVSAEADPRCAYVLLVRVPAIDSQAADEQVGQVRLVPNLPNITFAGRVRETCTASLSAAGIQIVGVPYTIRRGDREHDVRIKKKRAQRNIRLAEKEHGEQGPSARLWNCLGDAFQTLADNPRAVQCFRQALSIALRGSPEMLEAYYGILTSVAANDSDAQLQTCIEALEVYPLDAQLLCAMGGYLHARGHVPLAAQSYVTAYRFGQINPWVWHVSDIREIAAVCHSVTLQLGEQPKESVQFLEDALRDEGASVRIRRRLIEAYINLGNREAALAHVGALPMTTPHLEALRSAVRGACYAVQKNWIAAKAYLNAAYGHGCRDPLCFRWLATTLLAGGEAAAARPILEGWTGVEPRNSEPARLLAALDSSAATASDAKAIDRAQETRQIRLDGAPAAPVRAAVPLKFTLPTASPVDGANK